MATPPTSYGGYGGNANEKPKYQFEYPTGWKSEVPSKVCRVLGETQCVCVCGGCPVCVHTTVHCFCCFSTSYPYMSHVMCAG